MLPGGPSIFCERIQCLINVVIKWFPLSIAIEMNNLVRGCELCRISKLSRYYDNSNETRTWLTVCTEKLFLGNFTSFFRISRFLRICIIVAPTQICILICYLTVSLAIVFCNQTIPWFISKYSFVGRLIC